MITIYDIAIKAGVSPSTVSKVVNNYSSIPEDTKKKVRKAMSELNYIPNTGAKALSKGHSYNVGVLAYLRMDVSPFKHPLFTEILDSFQQEMNAKNYDLLFVSSNVAGQEGSYYENCVSRDVAGALLFGDLNSPEIREVINSEIPSVAFDYIGDKMSGVSIDNYEKMKELTLHLISLGHRNIVFIHGEDSFVTRERMRGFKDAFKERNIPFNERSFVQSDYLDYAKVRSLTQDILRRIVPPTAIMFPDDLSAVEGMKTLKEMGLSIPEDISITGFDGTIFSQIVCPTITTIKQDTKAIGRSLADELIRQMENKDSPKRLIKVEANFIKGESTGPLKNSNDTSK